MNRRIAIIVTAVAAMLCGLPGLAIACFGTFMVLVFLQMPSDVRTESSPEFNLLVGIMIALLGVGIILIPVGIGVFSAYLSRGEQTVPSGEGDVLSPFS